MKFLNKTVLASLVLAVSCLSPLPSVLAGEDGVSRIRMFGQNGALADLHPGSACLKRAGRERASGTLGSAFGSLVGKVSNQSLGIADSPTTRNLRQSDGVLSKAYFREYVIPSGIPTSVELGFQDVSHFYTAGNVTYSQVNPSCKGAVSFVPEAGKDYEAGFRWEGKACRITVNEIVVDGEDTKLEPVAVTAAKKC
jgi:hypothetical protein